MCLAISCVKEIFDSQIIARNNKTIVASNCSEEEEFTAKTVNARDGLIDVRSQV